MVTVESLRELSIDERLHLMDAIWQSLSEAEYSEYPPEHQEMVHQRLAAHRADPSRAIDWDTFSTSDQAR